MTDSETLELLRRLDEDIWAFFIMGTGPYFDDRLKDDIPRGVIPAYALRKEYMKDEDRSICARKGISGAYAHVHSHYPDESEYSGEAASPSYGFLRGAIGKVRGVSRGEIVRFVFRAMINEFNEVVRRKDRDYGFIDSIESYGPWHSRLAGDDAESARHHELWMKVTEACECMDEEDRDMIEVCLHAWELQGLDRGVWGETVGAYHRRKAAEMGITVATLYTRKNRVIARLRNKICELFPEEFSSSGL